ncbi:hypothetical protein IWQ60_001678 [Tieghemiomyces parasiticus]|uniref:Derlin n=1 Tax=Tieghemiomyces parasiticus TaxID=78921 RepID=A0A9W8DY41_9FUNG|nr:hypothetical protein IWQ60_001678 [Tieghemiomyces parasiticus]
MGLATSLQYGTRYTFFSWDLILGNYELWRLFTGFFFERLTLALVINLYFFNQTSTQLECDVYTNRKADYVFFYIFTMAGVSLLSYYRPEFSLSGGLFMAAVYLWSRFFPWVTVNLFFGIRISGIYLPWAFLVLDFLQTNTIPLPHVYGIIVAHLFYYLTVESAGQSGRPLLTTPAVLRRFFGGAAARAARTATVHAEPNRRDTATTAEAHPWGRGHSLGS